jgi:arsenate reductase
MSVFHVYHNPQCSKSRCAIDFLRENNCVVHIREYLKDPLTKEELSDILVKLGISAHELVRKNEAVFKEHFKGKTLNNDQWIDAMIQFPKLIERPIVVKDGKAVVARPTENILTLI